MKFSRFAPIGIFALIAIFLAIGLTRDPSAIPTEMIDRDVPEFQLPELRETQTLLSRDDLVGSITLLNVFGSWCVACLQEHPTLMELAGNDTVRIVGVNWRDTEADALDWLAKHGDPYDAIIFDAQSDLAIELGVTGAPETFVLDETGRIRFKQVGPITDDVWIETIGPVIRQLESASTERPGQ